MAVNFGDTLMEGSIEPTVKVQAPVQDNSGAVLAEALAPAAKMLGGIAGSLFAQGQVDNNAKILTQYENDLLDIADSVDQGSMSRNEAMIKARNLRRQYLSNAPGLQDDFDTVWTDFASANGLGHVVVQGTVEQQAQDATTKQALGLGYSMEEIPMFQSRLRQLTEINHQIEVKKAAGDIITETDRLQGLQALSGYAQVAYPVAQRQINEAMAKIQANPEGKAEIAAALNNVLGYSIAQLKFSGGTQDSNYIVAPIEDAMKTFNQWVNGEVENSVMEGALKTTQFKYDMIAASDPEVANFLAMTKLLKSAGLENSNLFTTLLTPEVIKKMSELGGSKPLNLIGDDDVNQRASAALREMAGSVNNTTDPEMVDELNNAINQVIDGTYINERSADGAMSFKDVVELLGSNEVGAFLSSHGKIDAKHAPQLVNILKNNYETELLPAVNRAWVGEADVTDYNNYTYTESGPQVQPLRGPMSQFIQPRWNGNAVEFVPVDEYANNPRVIQLATDATSGDNSIAVPLNNLINAYSNVTGTDGKQIYEQDFAGRLFGIGEEGGADEESEFSISPEDDAQLDLSSFQPDELVSPVQVASLGNVNLNDAEFIEPTSNPSVDPEVLRKFEGRRIPVSIRNNNMGAVSITGSIPDSWAAKQPGFVGVTPRPANEGGYYAKYATPEHGVAAASKLLELYGKRGVDSPAAIVRKWSVDRAAHNSYQNTLVRYLKEAGYNADANTTLDLNDPSIRMAILKAKSAHESGAGRPVYNDRVFRAGVGMGA